ncbi:MAG: hypothetical protein JSV03_07155 [Planctomycetota bacterium]|nr:MAG: hypothetical protein JSV03_07155 [Planctomycetota bacterium]
MKRLIAGSLLAFAINMLTACNAPVLLWPETTFKTSSPQILRIGASRVNITPQEQVFLAGSIPYRLSFDVHDEIWARVVAVDDGSHRIAIVSLDLIGLFYDDVVRIRNYIAQNINVDYVLIASTHTHNGPDLLGAWSPRPFAIDDPYRDYLCQRVVQAVIEALDSLKPAHIRIAVGDSGDPPLSRDSREPIFIDDTLAVWQAVDIETGAVIATAVHYASHPILIPSFNFSISSDFVHTLRESMESGMIADQGVVNAQGGVCVYFNGALGGRITPASAAPLTNTPSVGAPYALAQGYGFSLARRAEQLLNENAELLDGPMGISVTTRRLQIPVDNVLLGSAMSFSLVARAVVDGKINTEVGIIGIGPIRFFAVPGMIFPELICGEVTSIPGSDFPDAPPEQPVLADLADSEYFIVIGIANDILGNIIPKVLWDAGPPFTTDDNTAPYGEVISAGPETAGLIIDAFADIYRGT